MSYFGKNVKIIANHVAELIQYIVGEKSRNGTNLLEPSYFLIFLVGSSYSLIGQKMSVLLNDKEFLLKMCIKITLLRSLYFFNTRNILSPVHNNSSWIHISSE